MFKLMIASPCQNGNVTNIFTTSLVDTIKDLHDKKIEYHVILPETGAYISLERNKILLYFINSDFTHLLMIDNDIGWQSFAPIKFLESEKDFIGGVYPARHSQYKQTNLNIPNNYNFELLLDKNNNIISENDLLKSSLLPAGFIMITRKCIQTMKKKLPNLFFERKWSDGNIYRYPAFFNTIIENNGFWGEDFIFCKNAIKAGIDIWCDPTLTFNHSGKIGSLMEDVLIKNSKGSYYFKK